MKLTRNFEGIAHHALVANGSESVLLGVNPDGSIVGAENTNTFDGRDGWVLVQEWAREPDSLISEETYNTDGWGYASDYSIGRVQ